MPEPAGVPLASSMQTLPEGQVDGSLRVHAWVQYPAGKSEDFMQTLPAQSELLSQEPPAAVPPEHAMAVNSPIPAHSESKCFVMKVRTAGALQ